MSSRSSRSRQETDRGFRLYRPRRTVMTTCFRFLLTSHRRASPVTDLNKPPCSTVMLNLEQTCNNPHPHSPARTVIRTRLSAWACQPFCCQRTFYPSLSECPECLRTCLVGLTRSRARTCLPALPQSLGFCFGVLVALRLCFEIPWGNFYHSSLPLSTAAK